MMHKDTAEWQNRSLPAESCLLGLALSGSPILMRHDKAVQGRASSDIAVTWLARYGVGLVRPEFLSVQGRID